MNCIYRGAHLPSKLNGIPADSRAALWWNESTKYKQLLPKAAEIMRGLNDVAKARGQSLAQMSLAWILRDPRITSALIGASRVEQIEENVKALKNTSFSADELKKIDALTRN